MKPRYPRKPKEDAIEVPRPLNYELSIDPTREELNPKQASSPELGHVTWALYSARGFFSVLTVVGCLFAIFLTRWVFSAQGLYEFQAMGWIWALVCFSSLAIAAYEYTQRTDQFSVVGIALSGPLLMMLITVSQTSILFLLFGIALLLTILLADQILIHVGGVLRFRLGQSSEERKAWQKIWGDSNVFERFFESLPRRHENPSIQRHLRQLIAYRHTVYFIAGAYAIALAVYLTIPDRIYAPLLAVGGFGAFVILYGLMNLGGCGHLNSDSIVRLREGMRYWFDYNSHENAAPGVVQSPFGDAPFRERKATTVAMLFMVTLLPAASYFPVPVQISTPTPWVSPVGKEVKPPTEQEIMSSLSPSEQRFYDQANEVRRQRFIQVRMNRSVANQFAVNSSSLTTRPERWFTFAMTNIANAPLFFSWSIVLGFLLSVIVPPVMFLAVVYGAIGRTMHFFIHVFDVEWEERQKEETGINRKWGDRVRLIQSAKDKFVARQLFLGINTHGNSEVLFDRSMLKEHVAILGKSGSGKTSRAIAPMISQLISGNPKYPCSIVILDLKGDPALFQGARLEAEESGLPFKWFTNVYGRSTYAFNPLMQRHLKKLSKNQRANFITNCLGLESGEGYGSGFFSSQNRDLAQKIFHLVPDGELDSIAKFAEVFSKEKQYGTAKLYDTPDQKRNAQHFRSAVRQLGAFTALNVTDKNAKGDTCSPDVAERSIDATEIVSQPSVNYFYLRAGSEHSTVQSIGRLAIYSILEAANLMPGKNRLPVFLIIDEIQEIISRDLDRFFKQARAAEIGVVCSTQAYSDLKKDGVDLGPSVIENTELKLFHTFGNNDFRKMVTERSGVIGEEVEDETTVRVNREPRFNTNELLEVGAKRKLCYAEVQTNNGFTNFNGLGIIMQTSHHISQEEFYRRKDADWPDVSDYPGTMLNTIGETEPTVGNGKTKARPTEGVSAPTEKESSIQTKFDKFG